MRIPIVRGVIDRRILVNFRVDPDVLAKLLPEPFHPMLIGGVGMAGVCLIRLKHLRPRFFPRALGIWSENAAHRIAVTWEQDGQLREGVFVPRRDTSSRFNTLAGGRLFPGVHHHARFASHEQGDRYRVALDSDDGDTHLVVAGHVAPNWPSDSAFPSLRAASEFFEAGSVGYSAALQRDTFDGLELRCLSWSMTALVLAQVESSFFENRALFPAGSVEFDSALLMRGIEHEWHGREPICNRMAVGPGSPPSKSTPARCKQPALLNGAAYKLPHLATLDRAVTASYDGATVGDHAPTSHLSPPTRQSVRALPTSGGETAP